jgi:GDP-L-fucose synthase
MREFLHVNDLAEACLFLMDRYEEDEHINVGTGKDVTIRHLAALVRDIVYPTAELQFDPSKPDGMPRRVLDVSKLAQMGWNATIELQAGIRSTYEWFLAQVPGSIRGQIPEAVA